MAKKIEDVYKKLTQREHVLLRKNMYCGDPNTQEIDMYTVDDINNIENLKIIKKKIKYNAAFIKLFDEVISNASDAAIRYKNVTYIKTWVKDNTIIIENDCPKGGIPIQIHPKEKIYIPEMIFSHFLTGENYDDTDDKTLSGQNGLGIKLVNVLSKYFKIDLADGKKSYLQEFSNNLSEIKKPIIKSSKKNYVSVTFQPDFKQFTGIDKIDNDSISLFLKRIVDLAAYNPKIKFYFNDQLIKIKSIKDWMKIHLIDEESEILIDESDKNWTYGVVKSPSEQFEQISIASSVSTYRGGTHVNYISLNLSKLIADSFSKKIKANWVDVKNKIMLFLICKIPLPTFDSQTKESLTNNISKELLNGFVISDSLIKKIMKSEIVQSILEEIELKELRELNRIQKNLQTVKVESLIDAKGKNRGECVLGIFEGLSALSAVRKSRDTNIFGAFPIRGKFLNVSELSPNIVIKNEEVKNLISAIGIQLGNKVNIENLRYGKIYIYTDSDFDGDAIAALLINFFYKYWPELFEQGRIYKVSTPLLLAIRGKETKYFYTLEDYDKWATTVNVNQWLIEYKKGLGSLSSESYSVIINDPNLIQLTPDKLANMNLDIWFGKDSNKRKEKLI